MLSLEHRLDKWAVLIVIFMAGWLSSTAFYKVPARLHDSTVLAHVETRVLPALKTQVKAEHAKTVAATKENTLLKQAIMAGDSDNASGGGRP